MKTRSSSVRTFVLAFAAATAAGLPAWAGSPTGDFNQDSITNSSDLPPWNSVRFSFSSLGDADGDGNSDVTDLMIWDDNRGSIGASVVGVPDVFYNPATGVVSLVPNSTAIYAFKLPIGGAFTPVGAGLPGGGAWEVVAAFGALQGFDTTIVSSGTGTPAFPLGGTPGPVTIAQLAPALGPTAGVLGAFSFDTTSALRSSVQVQVVPEPAGAALAIGGVAVAGAIMRRRQVHARR